jgi:hypothetical protein
MGARGAGCSVFAASILFFAILFHASISAVHRAPLFLEPAPFNNLLSGQKIESSPGENFHAVALNEQGVKLKYRWPIFSKNLKEYISGAENLTGEGI